MICPDVFEVKQLVAKDQNIIWLYRNIYKNLSETYERKGDLINALKYSNLYANYSDSTVLKNKENITKNAETKHKFIEQKNLLEYTETQNKLLSRNQKLLVILSILGSILLVTSTTFLFLQLRQHKKNKQLLAELEFANQSKKRLLSVIGHDLIGSVGNLKAFTDLMIDRDMPADKVKRLIPQLASSLDTSYDLLSDLINWSKLSNNGLVLEYKQLSPVDLTNKCFTHLKQIAKSKQIELINNTIEVPFDGDNNMLLTILRNLVSNAIKFSSPKSTIQVSSDVANDFICFTVKDEGIGMSNEEISKILNEETSYHSKGTLNEKGSGLGINLCQSFIKKHGGELTIESTPNKGSSFHFTIPLVKKTQ